MSKEFRCNLCKKKVITERENTLHTTYSTGLCDDCKPKLEPEIQKEEVNPLVCPECDFVAKTEFGLKSHMRVHK